MDGESRAGPGCFGTGRGWGQTQEWSFVGGLSGTNYYVWLPHMTMTRCLRVDASVCNLQRSKRVAPRGPTLLASLGKMRLAECYHLRHRALESAGSRGHLFRTSLSDGNGAWDEVLVGSSGCHVEFQSWHGGGRGNEYPLMEEVVGTQRGGSCWVISQDEARVLMCHSR